MNLPAGASRTPSIEVTDETGPAPTGASRLIRSAIVRNLDHEDRLLLLLWHAEGLTPAEIGLLLHMTPDGITRRHERILAALRESSVDVCVPAA